MKNRKEQKASQTTTKMALYLYSRGSREVAISPITATRNLGRPPRHRPATAYPTAGRCEQAGKD